MPLLIESNVFQLRLRKVKAKVNFYCSNIFKLLCDHKYLFILISLTIWFLFYRLMHDFSNTSSFYHYTTSTVRNVTMENGRSSKKLNTTIIIISSTYYNKSYIYPKSSVVILFNTLRNSSNAYHWFCISSNATHKYFKSSIIPNKPFFQTDHCQMKIFAANCTTVLNPTYFALSSLINSAQKTELPLRSAITEKLPVVSCVSPLFFNERWQINLLSIEIYAYFGVSRQAYYYMSVLQNGFLLLKEYEKLRLIDMHPWVVPDVSLMRKGFEFRNQATAHNDCFLLYREAADFIIVHDPDDLLFIRNMTNFWTSFVNLQFNFPMVGNLVFPRFNTYARTAKTLSKTSISTVLKSMKIFNNSAIAKSVYFTRGIESIDSHFAQNYNKGYIKKSYDIDVGFFAHIRNLTYKHSRGEKTNMQNFLFNLQNVIDHSHFDAVEKLYVQRLSSFLKLDSLKTLSLTNFYYNIMDDCYERIIYKNPNGPCPSHYLCVFPKMPNIPCLHARNKYYQQTISYLTIYYPRKNPLHVVLKDGCKTD